MADRKHIHGCRLFNALQMHGNLAGLSFQKIRFVLAVILKITDIYNMGTLQHHLNAINHEKSATNVTLILKTESSPPTTLTLQSLSLLQSQEVQFFGATTLQNKILKYWYVIDLFTIV